MISDLLNFTVLILLVLYIFHIFENFEDVFRLVSIEQAKLLEVNFTFFIIINDIEYFFEIIDWHLYSSKLTARHKFLEAKSSIKVLIKCSKSLPVISKLLFNSLMNLLNNYLNSFLILMHWSFLFFIFSTLVAVDSRDFRRYKLFIQIEIDGLLEIIRTVEKEVVSQHRTVIMNVLNR